MPSVLTPGAGKALGALDPESGCLSGLRWVDACELVICLHRPPVAIDLRVSIEARAATLLEQAEPINTMVA